MVFACNVLFYAIFLIYSVLAIPLLTLGVAVIRMFGSHRRAMRAFRKAIVRYGAGIIFGLVRFFIRVRYTEVGSPVSGPAIYVANHRSSSDPFLMACLNGEFVQVVNVWPFRLPVLGLFARWAGYLSVREMSFDEFDRRCGRLLAEGVSIIGFPEGTRSGDRSIGTFHSALFRVALKYKADIVPLCIMGNEDKPARGSLLLTPGTVRVHRLEPIPYETFKELEPFKLKQDVRRRMSAYIEEVE